MPRWKRRGIFVRGTRSPKCNGAAKRSQPFIHTPASASQHNKAARLVGSGVVQEVDYEHETIAQNHWTHPGSIAPNKHRVIGRHNGGCSASLSSAYRQRATDYSSPT